MIFADSQQICAPPSACDDTPELLHAALNRWLGAYDMICDAVNAFDRSRIEAFHPPL
jgi:hypothetical protein